MHTHHLARILVVSLTAVGAGALAIGAVAASIESSQSAPKRITRSGVDGVKLGMTHTQLRQRGLVGRIRPGCELGGPNTRSARLLPPSGARSTTR